MKLALLSAIIGLLVSGANASVMKRSSNPTRSTNSPHGSPAKAQTDLKRDFHEAELDKAGRKDERLKKPRSLNSSLDKVAVVETKIFPNDYPDFPLTTGNLAMEGSAHSAETFRYAMDSYEIGFSANCTEDNTEVPIPQTASAIAIETCTSPAISSSLESDAAETDIPADQPRRSNDLTAQPTIQSNVNPTRVPGGDLRQDLLSIYELNRILAIQQALGRVQMPIRPFVRPEPNPRVDQVMADYVMDVENDLDF